MIYSMTQRCASTVSRFSSLRPALAGCSYASLQWQPPSFSATANISFFMLHCTTISHYWLSLCYHHIVSFSPLHKSHLPTLLISSFSPSLHPFYLSTRCSCFPPFSAKWLWVWPLPSPWQWGRWWWRTFLSCTLSRTLPCRIKVRGSGRGRDRGKDRDRDRHRRLVWLFVEELLRLISLATLQCCSAWTVL